MIRYNDTDEFNSIETGNTVYVSGIYSKNLSKINNKFGIVKDIFITKNQIANSISYVAKLEIESEIYFVNFDYIYKLRDKFDYNLLNNLIYEEEPFNFIIFKRDLVENNLVFDDNGQTMCLSTDSNLRNYVFLFSGLN